jgi:feruloyl esterase
VSKSFWAILLFLGGFIIQTHAAEIDSPLNKCKTLHSVDFSDVQDAPTQIIEAKPIGAKQGRPELCDIQGYVSPNVAFHLQLPLSNWNRKFIEVGCGGACGTLAMDFLCVTPLRRGYACINSDMGHISTGHDLKWAYSNLPAQIDFTFRATHVVALAGKAIALKYYELQAERSYLMGCSTGGHEGLVEAQRFPWDFDGIIAGAPSINMQTAAINKVWADRVLRDRDGQPLFTQADIRLLHKRVLSACDMDDGVKDGLVEDPSSCHVNLDALICKADKNNECLTRAQIQAAKMRYAGATTSKGIQITAGGAALGSEDNWLNAVNMDPGYTLDLFRYLNFMPPPGPNWKLSSFDFDRDYKRLGQIDSLYSASNPDLREFKRAGGKMILYHGWNDDGPSPAQTIDYYEAATRTMGGLKPTQDFFRLFLIPGMIHCTGGEGAYAIDYLSYLEDWVEHGQEPDKLVGAHPDDTYLIRSEQALLPPNYRAEHPEKDERALATDGAWDLQFPIDPDVPITFTRPIYPYPLHAKYKGDGDPNKAVNFVSVGPKN